MIVISTSDFPGNSGDSSNYLELLKALHQKGLELLLLCPVNSKHSNFDQEMKKHGTKIIRIPLRPNRLLTIKKHGIIQNALQYFAFNVAESFSLFYATIRYRPKAYLIRHNLLTLQIPAILFFLHMQGIADGEIISQNINDSKEVPSFVKKALFFYEKKIVRCYSFYACSTLHQKKKTIQFGFPEKRTIYRQVTMDISNVPHYDVNILPPATFGYFGTLEKWQGVDFLIKSLPKAIDKNEEIKLYIIGEGSQENYLQELVVQLGVSNNVFFCHGVPREILWKRYFKKFRVVIIPRPPLTVPASPIKLVEALAAGKPVISTNVLGIKEIVSSEDGVTFVDPYNVESLSDAIVELSVSESLSELQSLALKASARFNINERNDPIIKKIALLVS